MSPISNASATFWPAVTVAGPLFVIETSETAVTVVDADAVLLRRFGSFAGELAVAEFVIVPAAPGAVAMTVMGGADWPVVSGETAVLGHVHVMVPPEGGPHVQTEPEADAPVTPAGSVSTTVRLPTDAGPLFVTVTM